MEACEEVHQSIENPRLLQQSSWGTTLSFSTFSQIKLCDKGVTKRLILCLKCFDPTFKIQEGKKLAASRRALCIFFLRRQPRLRRDIFYPLCKDNILNFQRFIRCTMHSFLWYYIPQKVTENVASSADAINKKRRNFKQDYILRLKGHASANPICKVLLLLAVVQTVQTH